MRRQEKPAATSSELLLCHGAEHQLRVVPHADSPWANHKVRLESTLVATFDPPHGDYQVFEEDGALWNATLPANGVDTQTTLTLFSEFTALPHPIEVSTGHHRLIFAQTVQPPVPIVLDEDVADLSIRARSFYIEGKYIADVEIEWLVDDQVIKLPTGVDGWCKYVFEPQRVGKTTVVAKMWSPYEGRYIEHVFDIEVIATSVWETDLEYYWSQQPFSIAKGLWVNRNNSTQLQIHPKNQNLVRRYFSMYAKDPIPISGGNFGEKRMLLDNGTYWFFSTGIGFQSSALIWTCEGPGQPTLTRSMPIRFYDFDLALGGIFTLDGVQVPWSHDIVLQRDNIHTLKFTPLPQNTESSLVGLDVYLELRGADQGVIIFPKSGERIRLPVEGVEWTLDARHLQPIAHMPFSIRCTEIQCSKSIGCAIV